MKTKVLIVDDEAPIRAMLAFSLNRADMDVELAADGDEALKRLNAREPRPDLIVLDWMMPGLDGLQFTRTLRGMPGFSHIPIIMLTARGNESDRSRGLDAGADDFVVKPFSTRELISRVRAVLRRVRPENPINPGATRPDPTPLRVGDLVLDVHSHRAFAGDRPVSMGPTEFRLLTLFMRHPGRAWSRTQLLGEIWGDDHAVEERTVDVHIRRLRKALEQTRHDNFVQTVRGHGYRFSDLV
ncbi:MAG: phosphate regulon transcriptional regulator PhoB [Xanthomonadaceae bacterium]|nr:phosphate regulon transcriptional regulator PhoB [Xanthomonadaceae bacterium]